MENFIKNIKKEINSSRIISLKEIDSISKENTAVVIVDMVKGFYTEGPLASSRVEKVIEPIKELLLKFNTSETIVFIDSHKEECNEFSVYPMHCVKGSSEEELIPEIEEVINKENTIFIKKNSINGFNAKEFITWLKNNEEIKNFIIVGVCTDICVETFAMSLITYFNEYNLEKNIVIPINCVETFSNDFHNGDFMNLVSLFKMKSNGINIVKKIVD